MALVFSNIAIKSFLATEAPFREPTGPINILFKISFPSKNLLRTKIYFTSVSGLNSVKFKELKLDFFLFRLNK